MQDNPNRPASQIPSQPPSKGCGVKGCLGCLGIIFVGVLSLVGIGYYMLMHTSYPLQAMVEGDFDINGKPARVEGISGSISSGFKIERIVIEDEPTDSVIEGLTFRYSGIWDAFSNNQFIIEQLSADRCELIVDNDFLSGSDDDEEDDDDLDDTDDIDSSEEGNGDSFVFELRKLDFKNISLKSADGEVDISIPLIHLSGFKIDGNNVSLDELEVTSDTIELQLTDAQSVEIDGQTLPFQQMIAGKVLPKIHPLVKSDIDFRFEFTAVDGVTVTRLTAFKGQAENVSMPDGRSITRFNELSPSAFFDTTGQIFPEKVSLVATESDGELAIDEGEFTLGMTRFTITPQKINSDDPKSAIIARAEIDGKPVEIALRPDEDEMWPPLQVDITLPKNMKLPQQLALIYFQKPYKDLSQDEKSQVDKMVEIRSEEVESSND